MFNYFVRRLLLSVPTLLVISWIIFGLSKCAPIDPVVAIFGVDLSSGLDPAGQARSYRLKSAKLGLDRPEFYFSLTTTAYPDSLYNIFPTDRRQRLTRLAAQVNNWPLVSAYDQRLAAVLRETDRVPDSLPQKTQLRLAMSGLNLVDRISNLDTNLVFARQVVVNLPEKTGLSTALDSLEAVTGAMKESSEYKRFPRPALYWYGMNNQYNNWMAGFFKGELGTSLVSKRPVAAEIHARLMPTLALNGLAILLAYLISIPLGMRMARYKNSAFDRRSKRLLLLLYSFPVFWMGGMLILFFATPDAGFFWVKGIYVSPWIPGTSFLKWMGMHASKLILPILTLLVHVLAVLTLQMRSSMLDVLGQEYIKTARAKGLSEPAVQGKHAFRNALFPLITIFGSTFPIVFAGSLVIEYLFNFPGMGTKTQAAFMEQDYPVLFSILMIAAVLTILGSLVADMLYAWADPRVRYSGGKT